MTGSGDYYRTPELTILAGTIRRENDSDTRQEVIRENILPACFFWQNEHFAQNRPQY